MYASLLGKLLDVAEKEYYVKKLNSHRSNVKKNWPVLDKLLNRKSNMISTVLIYKGFQLLTDL